jgi:hypothetical protein
MSMRPTQTRVLDPLERFSEIVFGLIMVLTFTCAISVAESGKEEMREMIVGALGCNLAWGVIDAAFYLIACLTGAGRNAALLRGVQGSRDPDSAREIIASAVPPKVAEALQPADFERIHAHLRQAPPPPDRPRFTAQDWRGALGVFLLVFLSTFPVVIPFFFVQNAHTALRISNGVAIALLFASGYMLAGHAGLRRIVTGLAMVAIGTGLVALAMALGG